MRAIIKLAFVGAGVLALAGCETMNEQQCLAGEWSRQGYADGAAGHDWSRLNEHRKACARHGILADDAAYYDGYERGVRTYCQPHRGFTIGSDGGSYASGFCPADLERGFVNGFADGRLVYEARQRVAEITRVIDSNNEQARRAANEIRELEDRITDKEATEEQRRTWRERIRRLDRERRDHLDEARGAERALNGARREMADVENRLMPMYDGW